MVNPEQAYGYFATSFVLRKPSNGWFPFDCPFCGHDSSRFKMNVNFTYQLVKCWACEYKKYILQFVSEYEGLDYKAAKKKIENIRSLSLPEEIIGNVIGERLSALQLPHGYNSLMSGDGTLGRRAREYMQGRGFNIELLDSMGFGYCNEKHEEDAFNFFGYIIIPFKKNGTLMYFIGRDFTGNYRKYKNPDKSVCEIGKADLIYNEDALEVCKSVFISEGTLCAATCGDEGTATLGWSMSKIQHSKYLRSKVGKLIFLPDVCVEEPGKYYRKSVETAMTFLDHKKVYVVDMELLKEHGKDTNEIGFDKVSDLLRQTNELTYEKAIEVTT